MGRGIIVIFISFVVNCCQLLLIFACCVKVELSKLERGKVAISKE